MKRKIVKQGAATLTISLPSKWTQRFNLKPGDELDVEEKGPHLLLKNKGEADISTSNLDLSQLPKAIVNRYLIGAYKKGSDEINIAFSDYVEDLKTQEKHKTINFIQEVVDKLIGVEIIEQSKNSCKIKQITAVSEDEFDSVLRRIFLLLLSLSEEALEIVEKNSKDTEITENKHNNIDKFVNYCIRLLNKKGHQEKTTLYYYLIQELEEISDAYSFLVREFVQNKRKIDKKTVEVFKNVNDSLRTFYEYFYNFKKEGAVNIIKTRRKIFSDINALAKTHPVADNLLASRLSVIVIKILNLAETRMSMS
jgi:phosphate uptake regulator